VTVRLALLSDQHGNDVAFRAALADVERLGVGEIDCLGDVAQGGAEPAQTLDRLATLGCETVLGNADAFLLEVPADSPEPVTERQLEVREWTLSQLGPPHLEQLRSFAPVVRRKLDGVSLLLFHGSPRSYDDVLLPELGGEALEPFLGHDAALLAGGHTHLQWTRRVAESLYVNPGSIGSRTTGITTLPSFARWPSGRSSPSRTEPSPSSFGRCRMPRRTSAPRRETAAVPTRTNGPRSGAAD
jgi:predicted phosphodiesterase